MSTVWDLDARPPWYVQTGTMFENPFGVPRDEIIRFIVDNSPEVVAQVVFGKFVELSGLVFLGEEIQMLVDRSLPSVTSQTYIDAAVADQAGDLVARGKPWGQRWFTGIDFGRQTDFTVIQTLDTHTLPARTVYWRRLNRVPWATIYAEVGRVRQLFGPNILADSTGPGGDVVLDTLHSSLYCPVHHQCLLVSSPQCVDRNGKPLAGCKREVYLPLSCVDGFTFTASTKRQLITHLKSCLSVGYNPVGEQDSFGWIRTPPIPQLEEELTIYSWDDKRLQTDCVFALALAAWAGLEDPVPPPVSGSIFGQ